jgi:phenylacetate-CoA ligase
MSLPTWADRVYWSSPVFLQNLLISAYGLYTYKRRYGGRHSEYLQSLRESQWYPKNRIEELQFMNLSGVIRNAFETVPFYQEIYRKHGVVPSSLRSLDDLRKLPIITKGDLRANPKLFVSDLPGSGRIVEIHTSGTTGSPLTIYLRSEALEKNYAFFARSLEWAGVAPGQKSATFAGRVIMSAKQVEPPFWRKNWIMRNTLFSSYHISEPNLPAYVDELEKIQPIFIDSYPSAIFSVGRFLLDRSIDVGIAPKAIITSSETLFDNQREVIEKAFHSRVFDQYGSAEMVGFINQCEKGSYHVNPEYGIVEIIKGDGEPAKDGEPGELVCTGFVNSAMPLIRYKTGDSAIACEDICTCGRAYPVVKSILGRTDEFIVTRDGRFIGRLDPVFKSLSSGIKEAQIIQEDYDRIVVKIVVNKDFCSHDENVLAEELRRRIGPTISISIVQVNEIPRSNTGKFRSVLSRVGSKEGAGV